MGTGARRRSSSDSSSASEAPPSASRRLRRRIASRSTRSRTTSRERPRSECRCAKGVVAVDPKLIPLGTKLHVPGYGPGLAADVGYAIKGRIIDLWFPITAKARKLGPAHRHDHRLPLADVRRRRRPVHSSPMRARSSARRRCDRARLLCAASAPTARRVTVARGGSRAVRCARRASLRDRTAAIAVDLRSGETVFAQNARCVAPSGVGREARRLVHRAARARPALSLPHRGRRRRHADRACLERQPRPRRVRRPDADPGGSRTGSHDDVAATGIRRDRQVACSATTRTSTRDATRSAGSRPTSGSSRGRCRRSRSAGSRSPVRTARPRPQPGRSRRHSRRRGIAVDGRPGAGRAPARRVPHRLRPLASRSRTIVRADERGQRQLRRRDGA